MLDIKSVRSPVPCGHWSYTHTWIRTHKDPHIQLIQTQKDVHTHPLNTQRWTHTFTNWCLIKLQHKKASKLQIIKWIITDYPCTHLQIKPPDCQAKQSGHDSSTENNNQNTLYYHKSTYTPFKGKNIHLMSQLSPTHKQTLTRPATWTESLQLIYK